MYIAAFGQALEQSSCTAGHGHCNFRPTGANHVGGVLSTRRSSSRNSNTKSSRLLV